MTDKLIRLTTAFAVAAVAAVAAVISYRHAYELCPLAWGVGRNAVSPRPSWEP
jgi:hypothetical protein